MDDIYKPSKIDKEEVYKDIDKAMNESSPMELGSLPEHFKSMFKSMIYKAKQDIFEQQKETYDSMLTDVISDAMFDLEQYFKANYSADELSEISQFIESPAGQKMMLDMGSTELLMKQQEKVRKALNDIVHEMSSSDDMATNLSDMLISMSFPDDLTDEDEDFGNGYDDYDDYFGDSKDEF
jgi:hypothetical protein